MRYTIEITDEANEVFEAMYQALLIVAKDEGVTLVDREWIIQDIFLGELEIAYNITIPRMPKGNAVAWQELERLQEAIK